MAAPSNSVALTSEIINYLIYRYLQESGFTHTAFTFGYESSVLKTALDPNGVPPGSLVTFIQKGLQYLELEANIDTQVGRMHPWAKVTLACNVPLKVSVLYMQDGEVDGEYKMLTPEELITNDIEQLRLLVQERKEENEAAARPPKASDRRKDKAERKREREEAAAAAAGTSGASEKDKDKKKDKEAAGVSDDKPARDSSKGGKGGAAASAPATPMDEDGPSTQSVVVPDSSVLTLEGHDSEVYICSWSPVDPLLASGCACRACIFSGCAWQHVHVFVCKNHRLLLRLGDIGDTCAAALHDRQPAVCTHMYAQCRSGAS